MSKLFTVAFVLVFIPFLNTYADDASPLPSFSFDSVSDLQVTREQVDTHPHFGGAGTFQETAVFIDTNNGQRYQVAFPLGTSSQLIAEFIVAKEKFYLDEQALKRQKRDYFSIHYRETLPRDESGEERFYSYDEHRRKPFLETASEDEIAAFEEAFAKREKDNVIPLIAQPLGLVVSFVFSQNQALREQNQALREAIQGLPLHTHSAAQTIKLVPANDPSLAVGQEATCSGDCPQDDAS